MCIVFLAFGKNLHPKHRLVIASNRDEFVMRSTQRAHIWPVEPTTQDCDEGGQGGAPPSPPHTPKSSCPADIMVCGTDLERAERGTWLGMTRRGRFAFITNFREDVLAQLKAEGKTFSDYLSRGSLVSDFLRGDMSPLEYTARIARDAQQWLGFNLVVGVLAADGAADVHYATNRYHGRVGHAARLPDGVWGICNGVVRLDADDADSSVSSPAGHSPVASYASMSHSGRDSAIDFIFSEHQAAPALKACPTVCQKKWPKVVRGEERMRLLLSTAADVEELKEGLWEMMRDPTSVPDSELPDTGMELIVEQVMSSIHVTPTPNLPGFGAGKYGTRSSTLIVVDSDGSASFLERDWGNNSKNTLVEATEVALSGLPHLSHAGEDVERSQRVCHSHWGDGMTRTVHLERDIVEWRFLMDTMKASQ